MLLITYNNDVYYIICSSNLIDFLLNNGKHSIAFLSEKFQVLNFVK